MEKLHVHIAVAVLGIAPFTVIIVSGTGGNVSLGIHGMDDVIEIESAKIRGETDTAAAPPGLL